MTYLSAFLLRHIKLWICGSIWFREAIQHTKCFKIKDTGSSLGQVLQCRDSQDPPWWKWWLWMKYMAQTQLLRVFVNWFFMQHLKACAPYLALLWKGWRETGTSESKNQACSQQEWASFLALPEVSIAKHPQKQATHLPPGRQAVTLPPSVPLLHQHWVLGGATRRQVLHTPSSNA